MLDNQGCQTHLVAIMMTKSLFTLLESITFKNKTLGCTCKIFLENPRNISKTCGSKFLNLDLGAHYWTKQFQKTYVKITGRGKRGSVPSCRETFSYDLMLFNVQLHTLRKNLCYFKETLLKTVWKGTDSHEWQWCLQTTYSFIQILIIYYGPDTVISVTILTTLDTDIFEDGLMKTDKMPQFILTVNLNPVKFHKPFKGTEKRYDKEIIKMHWL